MNGYVKTLILGSCIAVGVMVGMIIAPVRAQSAFASVGYIDVQAALQAHPDLQNVLDQIQVYEDSRKEELNQYTSQSTLTAEQRSQMMEDLYRIQAEVDQERTRLTNPLIDDILQATADVAEESQSIEIILESGSVMWGGLNLTPLVIDRINGGG
ncbi:MAG TPA: OmpH family outer membrane protein [bacterium]|jgi:Skp family chaperone for outer membrane proteins